MMRITITETPSEWVGTLSGFADGPISSVGLHHLLEDAISEARTAKRPTRDVLVDRFLGLVAAKKEERVPKSPPVVLRMADPKPDYTTAKKPKSDPLGVIGARKQIINELLPGIMECDRTATTKEEFTAVFIRAVKLWILNYASMHGMIVVTENYQPQIWTPDFVKSLSTRIGCPNQKTFEMLLLKQFLTIEWEREELHKLDRDELARKVNVWLFSNYKPNAVYKTAYRLGLFNTRNPGPKGFRI